MAASGVDRWALQVYVALRIEALAPISKSAVCILGIDSIPLACPRLVEHNTHVYSRRAGVAAGSPALRAIREKSFVCKHAVFPTAVPTKWWHFLHSHLIFSPPSIPASMSAFSAWCELIARQCDNLVDPASSHMLVSKIKPCMSQYKLLYGETANGSLKQL